MKPRAAGWWQQPHPAICNMQQALICQPTKWSPLKCIYHLQRLVTCNIYNKHESLSCINRTHQLTPSNLMMKWVKDRVLAACVWLKEMTLPAGICCCINAMWFGRAAFNFKNVGTFFSSSCSTFTAVIRSYLGLFCMKKSKAASIHLLRLLSRPSGEHCAAAMGCSNASANPLCWSHNALDS